MLFRAKLSVDAIDITGGRCEPANAGGCCDSLPTYVINDVSWVMGRFANNHFVRQVVSAVNDIIFVCTVSVSIPTSLYDISIVYVPTWSTLLQPPK